MRRGDTLDARREYITRLRSVQGLTIEAIAVKLMCSYTLVQRKLKEWGVASAIEGVIEDPQPEPAPQIVEDIPPAKTARQLLDERNAAILELVDAGMRDEEIMRKLGLKTRGVVIGVRHRNGRVLGRDEINLKNRRNAKRIGTMQSARHAHLKTPIEKTIETPIAALAELEAFVEATPRPARAGVPFDQLTGCRWVYGDIRDNPPISYCNAPCCKVVVRGISTEPVRVRYCADHWERRRSSNFTKIVA